MDKLAIFLFDMGVSCGGVTVTLLASVKKIGVQIQMIISLLEKRQVIRLSLI